MEFEEHELHFMHSRLCTLEDIDLDNDDLNAQIKKYKQLLKQLKLENISIKNENKKYKLALENYNQQKQKREEIYTNNKLNSENKVRELEEENESLRLDIAAMTQPVIPISNQYEYDKNVNITSNMTNIEDETQHIQYIKTPINHNSHNSNTGSRKSSISNATFDQAFIFGNNSAKDLDQELFNNSMSVLSNNFDSLIKQSVTNKCDSDGLLAKIDQYESVISELKDKVTSLKFKNKQLTEKLDSNGSKCVAMQWFSDLIQ